MESVRKPKLYCDNRLFGYTVVMQIVVNDLLTSYQLSGAGKLVVLLHGWGDSSQGSLALQAALAKHYQVFALDLPGFGGTKAPATAWGLNEYADFVAAALDKLELKSYAVVGHSNGGAIAIRGLAKGSLNASKLVLVASAGIRNQYSARNKALRLAAQTGKIIVSPLPARIQKKLKASAYKSVGSDLFVAEHMQETFKRIITDDVQADTARVQIPSLLIYGFEDTATPVYYGELLQSGLEHSELHVVPNAGHFVHLDKPAIVLGLIEEFLA